MGRQEQTNHLFSNRDLRILSGSADRRADFKLPDGYSGQHYGQQRGIGGDLGGFFG